MGNTGGNAKFALLYILIFVALAGGSAPNTNSEKCQQKITIHLIIIVGYKMRIENKVKKLAIQEALNDFSLLTLRKLKITYPS